MAIDTDVQVLLNSSTTMTSSTVTSAYNGENMDRFVVQAVISAGSFTSGMYAYLQASVDGTNYADIADSTATISATGTKLWNYDKPAFNYTRVGFVIPSGFINSTVTLRMVGER